MVGREALEAEVAGREVELLVEAGVVGDVHLAVLPDVAARAVEHGGGVVVEPGGAALEEARHDRHVEFGGELGEGLGARAGDGLGEGEEGGVLGLAEVARAEELGQADHLGPAGRGFADAVHGLRHVGVGVLPHRHLNEAEFHRGAVGHGSGR